VSAVVRETDVVVIGAGQAGLSSGYFLRRAGFPAETGFVLLDHDRAPGGAWQHRWPTLRMETVHGIFALPGMPFEPPGPDEQAAVAVPRYFAQYEQRFDLPVRRPVTVDAVRRGAEGRLLVEGHAGEGREADGGVTYGGVTDSGVTDSGVTDGGTVTWAARAVINATGTWTRPFWPYYPGRGTFRGRQLHAANYQEPASLAGRRVVVVGGGSSAVQLLAEISRVAETTWVTRRPPVFHERPFTQEYGRDVVATVERRVRAGLPPASVVSATGLGYTPVVLEARDRGVLKRLEMFDRITPDGVAWDDGRFVEADVILWCTGWRPAIDHLAPLHLRSAAGGIVMDGTRAVAEPGLHLVGYGPSASTVGANRAGRAAVAQIRELLGATTDSVPAHAAA
jgi:cation diffusion facilitator CzcD-associated flavoprotein CzcO